jgi:hypothetical protein
MKMKKYLIFSLALSLLFSCDDALDRVPVDSLVEQTAYTSVADLEAGLAGVLGQISFNAKIRINSTFTDDCKIGVDNGGQELNYLNLILDPNTNSAGIWNNRYSFINGINRLLQASSGIAAGVGEQDRKDYVTGQCLAFRAWAHYDLLLYYGLEGGASALGVPYVDYVSADATPARNTTEAVLTAIADDLAAAETLLISAAASDVNFASADFVTFLRARIGLEYGDLNLPTIGADYDSAILACDDLIAKYPLADFAQYLGMFTELNNATDTTEVIWKYDNVQGFTENFAGVWAFTANAVPGPTVEMSNGLYNSFLFNGAAPDDIRINVVLNPNSDVNDNLFIINKYPPNGDASYVNDYKGMRISEIYLIRAEANVRKASPNLLAAAADVFSVRFARNISGTVTQENYANSTAAFTDILLERRRELCFEGHRYTDLKRMRDALGTGMVRNPLDCGDGIPCDIPANDKRWIHPIPIGELNANEVIRGQQAPGY